MFLGEHKFFTSLGHSDLFSMLFLTQKYLVEGISVAFCGSWFAFHLGSLTASGAARVQAEGIG